MTSLLHDHLYYCPPHFQLLNVICYNNLLIVVERHKTCTLESTEVVL